MCQTIGTCYVETPNSPLVEIREKADYWLFHNKQSTSNELKKYIEQLCKLYLLETKTFLDYARKDLEWSRSLANNLDKSEAIRTINRDYCEFYERVFNSFST